MGIGFTNKPFERMMDAFAKSLTHTPVTKTVSNSGGDETLTEGTPVTISGNFYRKEDEYAQKKPGLLQNADAILLVKKTITINKDDLITYAGQEYRVKKVVDRGLGTTDFYNVAQLFKND